MTSKRLKDMKVPNLRFLEFEEEWVDKKLEEVFSIFNGYAFPSIESVNQGIPWVKIADVGIQEMRKENLSFLPTNFKEKYSKFSLKEGDYVVALTRPILNGKLKIARIDSFFDGSLLNQRVGRIETSNSKGFVYCYLQKNSLIKSIENNIAGSDPPNLSPNEINAINLTIPHFAEQEKIANFFKQIDKRITTQNKIIEELITLKDSLIKKIFSQDLKFKDNNRNEFPKWSKTSVGDLLKIGNGRDYKHLKTGAIPVYGTGGIITYVDNYLYEGETVCIGRKGTINKPIYLNTKIWTVDTLFYTYSFKNCIPKFIYQLFHTINWLEYNEASGVPSLSKATIEKIKVIIPSIDGQVKIASFFSSIDSKINTEIQLLQKLEAQKKYLLNNLFV